MVSVKIKVQNMDGLHLEEAIFIAKEAEKCSSTVEIYKENSIINCKNILCIVSGMIWCEDEIVLVCTGPDESSDLEHMVTIFTEICRKQQIDFLYETAS